MLKKIYDIDASEQIMCDNIHTEMITFPKMILKLDHPIDRDILLHAAQRTLRYHPYFKTRLIKENGVFYWQQNDLPVIIKEMPIEKGVRFGDVTNNYYPWVIAYHENHIMFTFSHQLVDGGGARIFIATFMEYYISEFEHDLSEPEGFTMSEERVAADSALPTQIAGSDEDIKALYMPGALEPTAYKKDAMRQIEPKQTVTLLSINLSSVEREASKFEVTPFAVVGPILAKAVKPYLEEGENRIAKLMIPMAVRKMFASTSCHNFSFTPIIYYYYDKMDKMSPETVATVFRSRMDLLSDKSNIQRHFANLKKAGAYLSVLSVRQKIQEEFNKKIFERTTVAYTHMTKTGLSERVNAHLLLDFNLDVCNMESVVCIGTNDKRHINLLLCTRFVDDRFIRLVTKQLDEMQITYERTDFENVEGAVFTFDENAAI